MIYETEDNQLINLNQMGGIQVNQHGDTWQVVVQWTLLAEVSSHALYETDEDWKAQIAYECIRDAYKLGLTLISHAEIEQQIALANKWMYAMTSTSTAPGS